MRLTKFAVIGSLIVTGGAGCALRRNSRPAELDPTPVATDAAMEKRCWDETKVVYANSSVIAGNTGFYFVEDQDQPDWVNGVVDPFTFFGNLFAMPVSFIQTPAWRGVEYRAETVEPTYHANPPLPPPPEDEPPAENGASAPTAPESSQPPVQPEPSPSSPAPAGG